MKRKMIKDVQIEKELFGMKQLNTIIVLVGIVAGFTIYNQLFRNFFGLALSFYNMYFCFYFVRRDNTFKHQYRYEVLLSLLEVNRVRNKK